MTVGNEEGVIRLNDDEVVDSKEGDFKPFLVVEDDVVLGINEGEIAVGSVIAVLLVEIFSNGDPRTDVVPVKGRFDIKNSFRVFHEGVVDGDGGEPRELGVDGGVNIAGLTKLLDKAAEFGGMLFQLVQNGGNGPDEHAGIPGEVTSSQEFFSEFGIRLFAKAGDFEGSILNGAIGEGGLRAALDVAVARACPSRFDSYGDEGVSLVGDFYGIAHNLLIGGGVLDELVGGENHHGGFGISSRDEPDSKGDCWGGVALGWFSKDVFGWKHGGDFARLLGLNRVGENEDVFVWNESLKAGDCLFEERSVSEEVEELLRLAIAREGPEAGSGATSKNECVVRHAADTTEKLIFLKRESER